MPSLASNGAQRTVTVGPQLHPCHCLCAMWKHLGICLGEQASTTRTFESQLTGRREVPLCAPCAADIDRQGGRRP